MPTFHTVIPISVTLDLARIVAEVRVVAGERTDTVVEVRPSDESSKADVKVAEQTRVEFTDGRLRVEAPKQFKLFGLTGSADVTIELPAGSDLRGEVGHGGIHCVGRLGECRLTTHYGNIQLDETGPVQLTTALGEIVVQRVAGRAEVGMGAGTVRIGEIDGSALIKNRKGESIVGESIGPLRIRSNSRIQVDRAHAGVDARSARGDIRVAEAVRDSVVLETADGEVEVGIREGSAAWLDVSSKFGSVRNALDTIDGPAGFSETVEVRAHTGRGDVVIRRS